MKIAFLGPVWPWRGGIAQFISLLAEELQSEQQVRAFTFIKQYPKLIFPGKEQLDKSAKHIDIDTIQNLIPYNPLTWKKTAKDIIAWNPDLLILKYWIPFFAPAFGYIIRYLKKHSDIKVHYIIDNIDFHEKWFAADLLSKYALNKADRLICMSGSVYSDAKNLLPNSEIIATVHPVYDCYDNNNFSAEKVREEMQITDKKVILFFGYIKAYKGLDLLIKAFPKVKQKLNDAHLLIVGEIYGDDSVYLDLIKNTNLQNEITFVREFVPNEEIEKYFKVADVLVLPYKSATQSGVAQIAYSFDLGVVCTPVGGLPEIILDKKTGIVTKSTDPEDIAQGIIDFFDLDKIKVSQEIRKEYSKYSWSEFIDKVLYLED